MMDCRECQYFNNELNICNDLEVFVNRDDIKDIVCRFDLKAIPFKEAYDDIKRNKDVSNNRT